MSYTDYRLVRDDDGQLDVDTTFAVETDPAKVLVWDLYKIVTTRAGTLWWAPTATEDVTQAPNDTMGAVRRAAMAARLQAAIELDPRFSEVTVDITQRDRSMTVSIRAVGAGRTIVLVLVTQDNGTLRVEEAAVDGNVL